MVGLSALNNIVQPVVYLSNKGRRIMHQAIVKKLVVLLLLTFGVSAPVFAEGYYPETNGFDTSSASIPVEQIMHGGPPRDGIPALTKPTFVDADQASFLEPDARVIGVNLHGQSKAYPIAILNYHEIVNDELGGQAIAVTFCPLCGTGIVYEATNKGKTLEFGVSGLLYNSDVLLYDRNTDSLWSQILSKAVSGPMQGTLLKRVPAQHTNWATWLQQHPDTRVLSQNTGHQRDYRRTPYEGYNESASVYFPLSNRDTRYHSKEIVITLELDEHTKAYPFVELAQYSKNSNKSYLNDTLAGQKIRVEFDLDSRSGRILNAQGEEIPTFQAFWFSWLAFHPDSEVFTANP